MKRRNIIFFLIVLFGVGMASCKSRGPQVYKPKKNKKCNCPNGF